MNAQTKQLTIGGHVVEVVRKRIKNLYLRVEPPNGRVRIAAPWASSDAAIRQLVNGKLAWIERHQARIAAQPLQPRCRLVSGENHYLLGQPLHLQVIEHAGAGKIVLRDGSCLAMYVRPKSARAQRQAIMQHWYRE